MKKRFSEEQTVAAVKRMEGGTTAKELSREMGVTQQTLYHWKKRYAGMDVSEARQAARTKLNKLPKNSAKERMRHRCALTGRARGTLRKFGLSRNMFRKLANQGQIPGVTKSSW